LSDHLIRCLVKDADLRVLAVVATDTAKEAATRHKTAPSSSLLLAEALAGTLLLSRLQKEARRVILQIECDGPLRGLMADCDSEGRVRGYARVPTVTFPSAQGPLTEPAFGTKILINVMQEIGGGEWYRGTVEVEQRSLARAMEAYLLTSAQLDTVVSLHCEAGPDGQPAACTGLFFQLLPNGNPAALEAVRLRVREGFVPEWIRGLLAKEESPTAGNLLDALMGGPEGKGGENLQFLERAEVGFHCGCTRERMLSALRTLSEQDLVEMIEEKEDAEVICDYCSTQYLVPPKDLMELMLLQKEAREVAEEVRIKRGVVIGEGAQVGSPAGDNEEEPE